MKSFANAPHPPDVEWAFTLDTDRAAIFDLDGTLADSVDGITLAVNRLLRSLKATPLQREESTALLGDGLETFARRACNLRHVALTERGLRRFLRDYLANPLVGIRLYPHVASTLRILVQMGWRLAVCTNKAEAPAMVILDGLGILDYFDVVCCGDSVDGQKPNPQHIDQTLQRGGLHGLPAVMIGDNVVDVAAASAYGIPSVFAAWGYGQVPSGVHESNIAARFADLPAILNRVIPPPAHTSLQDHTSTHDAS